MRTCRICGGSEIENIHKGTRDCKDIDVLKCRSCGLVFLSKIRSAGDFYADGDMRKGIDFLKWKENTYADDNRRVNQFKKDMHGKSVLDFGCGNGGFLELAMNQGAAKVAGVEQDREACSILCNSGIECYQDVAFAPRGRMYDLIFMFHVIEHLSEPENILNELSRHMTSESKLIIETPNANDALLSTYKCRAFADFTYWSPHIFLYNENTLEAVVRKAGLRVVEIKQIQRYPLANHLMWLAKGLPGGGINEFKEFNQSKLNDAYTNILKENKICDTLMCTIKLNNTY